MDMRAAKETPRVANDTDPGLSSAVITQDFERSVRFARRIQASMTHVNDHAVNDEPNTVSDGEKMSGLRRFGGRWMSSPPSTGLFFIAFFSIR